MELWEKFVEAVARHFRFLETELGFVRAATKRPNVIYEREKIQVQIYYDADGRHELDLGLKKRADDPRKPLSLGIGMLMRLNGGSEGYTSPFPSTPEALEAEVERLAELVRTHGMAVLRGDLRDFDRMEGLERELAAKFGPSKQRQ